MGFSFDIEKAYWVTRVGCVMGVMAVAAILIAGAIAVVAFW